jgi:hypothetical protein
MDNLFNSKKLNEVLYRTEVLVHGVVCTNGQGISSRRRKRTLIALSNFVF